MSDNSPPVLTRRLTRQEIRILADNQTVTMLQTKLRTLGERSTFHGIDVLLEAKPGWMRRIVLLIVLIMCIACVLTVSHLVAGFINMPISTVINYGKANFNFPMVTICPDSPFSMDKLEVLDELRQAYLDAANFWIQNAQREPNATFERGPPEGYWRQRTKRTLRSLFFANRDQLIWDWQDYFVSCEFDGRKCDLDAVALVMPTAIMPTSSERALPEKSEWNYPGLIKEVTAHTGPKLPSAWPDDEPDLRKMNYEPPEWPRGKVVIIDHPSKYFCFQLRLKTSLVKEPGSTRGLHLVLRRPYNAQKTVPGLLTIESRAQVLQTWDDRLFLNNPSSPAGVRDAKRAIAMDGFHVIIHGDSKNTTAGSFPVDDVNKAGSSRSAYSFGIRFGQQVSISLGQFVSHSL
ncbi:hypothetical protein EG68_10745 [Paragonimus skrjabini miyazakii]|uniref:Amiloride-sensitive sodium channel n=1 Tax=Paragonimus skrjabini miyazakii TaxID=59628 RepID=A0A8S9Y9G4_9TREM|nr:hypothetical protein EG68_10745 [Paragonimus skrjabini miyazakii]